MAIIQSGASSATQTIDSVNNAGRVVIYDANNNQVKADTDGNARVQIRPPAFGALGAYAKSLVSGLIVATGSVNAVLWMMPRTDGTRFALIERIRVNAVVTGTITTAVPYNLALLFARSFTVSPTTSIGTTATLTGSNAKRRTSMGTTLLNGMWILGTAAAGLTGQTVTNDTDALATLGGASGTVIGNQFFGPAPANLWDDNVDAHPLILAANEGLVITAPLAGPATGTFQVIVSVDWMEVAAY
jgi:hypothetical protein